MKKDFLKRSLQRAALITATASLLLVFAPLEVEAAKPPPMPLSCSISPADGATAAGVPIRLSAMTQGGKGSKTYSWDLSDGSGVPAASTENMVDVTYSTVGGPYNVYLGVTDKQGATASCSTTVTVTQGGVNIPPVANDDGYSTDKNTTLNVAAPGVLDNDTDANNDPLTAILQDNVSNGTLTLNDNGFFNYMPNTDYIGDDTFSYFAFDGTALSDTTATVTISIIEDTPPPPVGEELYEAKCLMCHGEYGAGGYAHRSIRGSRASRISNAMTKWPEMAFLTYLTSAELADIETYLDNVPRGDRLPRNGDTINGEL